MTSTHRKMEFTEIGCSNSQMEEIVAVDARTDIAGREDAVAVSEGAWLPHDDVENLPDLYRRLSRFSREFCAAEGAAVAYEKAAELADKCHKAEGEHLLTYAEAAELVGRSRWTIAKAVQEGRLINHGRKFKPRVRASEVRRVFQNPVTSQGPASHLGVDARARVASAVRSA